MSVRVEIDSHLFRGEGTAAIFGRFDSYEAAHAALEDLAGDWDTDLLPAPGYEDADGGSYDDDPRAEDMLIFDGPVRGEERQGFAWILEEDEPCVDPRAITIHRANMTRAAEVEGYAGVRGISLEAAIIALVNSGLSHQPRLYGPAHRGPAEFAPGDRVATSAGIAGTVTAVAGDVIEVLWDRDEEGGPYEDEISARLISKAKG